MSDKCLHHVRQDRCSAIGIYVFVLTSAAICFLETDVQLWYLLSVVLRLACLCLFVWVMSMF